MEKESQKKVVPKFLIIILLVLGGIAILLGIGSTVSNIDLLFAGIQTEGKVVDLRKLSGGSSAPIVEYKDKNGKEYTYSSGTSTIFETYSVGDIVEVFYDPADPESATINSFFGMWGFALISFLTGGLFILSSIVALKNNDKLKRMME